MKFWTKKRAAALGLAALLTLSLAACGEKAPSLEEVEQAIEAGTLTVEDAQDKGWVDQAWVDGYWEARTVPAVDKIEINRVGEFTTTTLSGEPFTQEDLGHVLLFAFVDPASEDAGAFYDAMTAAWDGVQEAGAGMVLCLKGEDERGQFADAPFPVILYNDSLKEALGNNSGMVEDKDVPNTASWYVNGSFLSAWALVLDAEELPEDAAAFAKVSGQARQRKLRSGQQRSICHEPYGLSRHEKDDHALPAGQPC